MDRIRFPFTPVVPGVSTLWELNLRTYVKYQGIPGIYFFCLDTPHRMGNWIANNFFHLPYRFSTIEGRANSTDFSFSASGLGYEMGIEGGITAEAIRDPFQKWVTERYHLFLQKGTEAMRGDVIHDPWETLSFRLRRFEGNFAHSLGVPLDHTPNSIYYARPIRVRFKPFLNLGKLSTP